VAEPPRQLAIPLPETVDHSRDAFLEADCNRAALAAVTAWPAWPSRTLVLSGPEGSGKTHLAAFWAETAGARAIAAAGLEAAMRQAGDAPLAVEDVPPDEPPETALFHLINAAAERGSWLLLTSCREAALWRVALPDLRSRLRQAAEARLAPPDDAFLRALLVKLFADRQLAVERPVLDYLLQRVERSPAAIRDLVARLDAASLARGRAVTRALAREVLAEGAAGEGGLLPS